MLLISHRGNLSGPNKNLENNPEHILTVIKKYNVEIDLWCKNGKLFLGHDEPRYQINDTFFIDGMWVHCKNIEAVQYIKNTSANWFWHENDKLTLTSHKYVWCYPGIYLNSGITVEFGYNSNLPKDILGVCTDYPELYK